MTEPYEFLDANSNGSNQQQQQPVFNLGGIIGQLTKQVTQSVSKEVTKQIGDGMQFTETKITEQVMMNIPNVPKPLQNIFEQTITGPSIPINTNNTSDIVTPFGYHTIITSFINNQSINVLPSGHIIAKGIFGPYCRFLIEPIYDDEKDEKEDKNVIVIKSIATQQYLCSSKVNNKIELSGMKNKKQSLWKVDIINNVYNDNNNNNNNRIPSETKYIFQSLFNERYLSIQSNTGIIITKQKCDDASCYFSLSNIIAKQFKLMENMTNNIMNMTANVMNNSYKLQNNQNNENLFTEPMKGNSLNKEQLEFFKENGYVVIQNAIPETQIKNALKYINQQIGFGQHTMGLRAFGFWNERHESILDLYFQSNAYSLVRSLLGDKLEIVLPSAQIALRYPVNGNKPNTRLPNNMWHVDGMRLGNQIGLGRFSVLCAFVLSDWNEEYCGNFVVFPGEHYTVFEKINQFGGKQEFMDKVANSEHGVPFVLNGKSKQIIAKKGDFVICHPLLPHRACPNFTENIRYAVFTRPTRCDHYTKVNTMLEEDMFCQCDGLEYEDIAIDNNDLNQIDSPAFSVHV